MPLHRLEPVEDFGLSIRTPPSPDLQELVSASPSVASLLPGLMRSLADEIERETSALPISPDASPIAGLHQPLGPSDPGDVQSLARHVASGLSMTLSRYLARSLTQTMTLTSGTPGASVREASAQSIKTSTAEAADSGGDGRLPGFAGSQPRLQLKLLGTPEISLDGIRLDPLERCSRASMVIYILALHRRGLSGEHLAAYVTSSSADMDPFDASADMGLGAVRTFIWRLRKLAGWRGIVVSPGEQGGCQNRYRLPDDTMCDLWEFEANLNEAGRLAVRANIEPDAADRAAALRQEAILLYGGDFCKGVGAGSISQASEYLRHRYLEAILLQATYWKDRAIRLRQERHQSSTIDSTIGAPSVSEENAWLQALSNYRLAAQVEPYDESAYVGAMLCQAHLGHRKGIQKTLALCSRVLNRELDRSPLPTTMRTAGECLQIASKVTYI